MKFGVQKGDFDPKKDALMHRNHGDWDPKLMFFFDTLIRTIKKSNMKKIGDLLQFHVRTYWYAFSENWS